MNDQEFKRHLKDLVHGKHHPEEHDWGTPARGQKKTSRQSAAKKTTRRK